MQLNVVFLSGPLQINIQFGCKVDPGRKPGRVGDAADLSFQATLLDRGGNRLDDFFPEDATAGGFIVDFFGDREFVDVDDMGRRDVSQLDVMICDGERIRGVLVHDQHHVFRTLGHSCWQAKPS